MDSSRTLGPATETETLGPLADCLGCGQPAGKLPPLRSAFLKESLLRRCRRCGLRQTAVAGDGRVLVECDSCGLPLLVRAPERADETRCSDCDGGDASQELLSSSLSAATEHEVRLALESRWRFLTSRSATVYMDKVLRQVAGRIEGLPDKCRVALFDDRAPRTLALPSGLILVSQGTLDLVEDEAQLAFLLAHDLAHVASGDGAARLVRLGFHAVAREDGAGDKAAWADAAEDLVRLGCGNEQELEADRCALEAVIDLGYDPESVVRLLQRVGTLVERGTSRMAELALAHPPAGQRLLRVEEVLHRRVDAGGRRPVNREVFRRAIGRHSATMEWTSLRDLSGAGEDGSGYGARPIWRILLPWVGLGAALLAALIILLKLAL